MEKKTYLYDEHILAGAKLVPFAGWLLPIQYNGLQEEHLCVRNKAGLFDVSHMGEIRIKGPGSLEFLESVTTNKVSTLKENQAQYNLLPNFEGGIVDDIYIYCLKPQEDYLICVNAANDEKDWKWLNQHNHPQCELIWESSLWSQIAVQGPQAKDLLGHSIHPHISSLKKNEVFSFDWKGFKTIFASSGYTGEEGGEIFIENNGVVELWKTLLKPYDTLQAQPCGLGARDTLRTEMGYPLYGNELNDSLNPLAAGLSWVIKSNEKDFIGKDKILENKQKGLSFLLIGLEMAEKTIPRSGYEVFSITNEKIGWVTSGTFSPSLQKGIAMAYVAPPFATINQEILVSIRNKKHMAKVVKRPFIKK